MSEQNEKDFKQKRKQYVHIPHCGIESTKIRGLYLYVFGKKLESLQEKEFDIAQE